MAISTVRRVASRIYGIGESRIKIMDPKRALEALTADDVRQLVKEKVVVFVAEKAPSRAAARLKQKRKSLGRRRGRGSKKGTSMPSKTKWILKIRGQRKLLASLKSKLKDGKFRKVYKMVKGNAFKSKQALSTYLKDNQLMK
ncbi:MAG: 50S ribosomal protein L19e [Candidatus Micrarchaeota archaeon]